MAMNRKSGLYSLLVTAILLAVGIAQQLAQRAAGTGGRHRVGSQPGGIADAVEVGAGRRYRRGPRRTPTLGIGIAAGAQGAQAKTKGDGNDKRTAEGHGRPGLAGRGPV